MFASRPTSHITMLLHHQSIIINTYTYTHTHTLTLHHIVYNILGITLHTSYTNTSISITYIIFHFQEWYTVRVSDLKEALSDLLIDVTEEQVMKLHLN